MARSTGDCNSDQELNSFLLAMTDMGFGNLPETVLLEFYQNSREYYGYIPLPGDDDWEDFLENAAKTFSDD
ncbi:MULTISPECIES: hypothetical protein [Spirulina]|uniref:hypothetical protein n=2 Tax=Spirulinaceae TaxID=1890448 RepID=UPI00232F9AEB|nr:MULTISPECIES: hypothetical protein [Spirulina]